MLELILLLISPVLLFVLVFGVPMTYGDKISRDMLKDYEPNNVSSYQGHYTE